MTSDLGVDTEERDSEAGSVALAVEGAGTSRRAWLRLLPLAGVGAVATACRGTTSPTTTAAPAATTPPPLTVPVATAPPTTTPPTTAPPTTAPPTTAPPTTVPPTGPPAGFPSATALHAARRLTWGSTPALTAEIETQGVPAWLDAQIAWSSIDDSAVEAMLAPWPRPRLDPVAIAADQEWRVPWEMAAHETLRRVFSRRQLHELMVDFWHDHFSIDANHSPARLHLPTYDRTVIRAHALGKFRDMLRGVATSPAMLFFLDQASSRADGGRTPNENYARELMELHNVGSEAGYTQEDVLAVAHLFTGWSVTNNSTGTFTFRSSWHNPGPLTPTRSVLGWTRGSLTGQAAGLAFLDHLAVHPRTAQRLCHKLAVRLIGEHVAPTDAAVTTAASAYLANDTSIAAAVRSLVLSSAFASSAGAKVRRPADLATQMFRALGARWVQPANPDDFLWSNWNLLDQLGHAPHTWPTPDGFPDEDTHWISVGSLVSRWNMATWLSYNCVPGMVITARDTMAWAPTNRWGEWLDAIARGVLQQPWPAAVRQSVFTRYSVTESTVFRSWDHYAAAPVLAVLLQTAGVQRR